MGWPDRFCPEERRGRGGRHTGERREWRPACRGLDAFKSLNDGGGGRFGREGDRWGRAGLRYSEGESQCRLLPVHL